MKNLILILLLCQFLLGCAAIPFIGGSLTIASLSASSLPLTAISATWSVGDYTYQWAVEGKSPAEVIQERYGTTRKPIVLAKVVLPTTTVKAPILKQEKLTEWQKDRHRYKKKLLKIAAQTKDYVSRRNLITTAGSIVDNQDLSICDQLSQSSSCGGEAGEIMSAMVVQIEEAEATYLQLQLTTG